MTRRVKYREIDATSLVIGLVIYHQIPDPRPVAGGVLEVWAEITDGPELYLKINRVAIQSEDWPYGCRPDSPKPTQPRHIHGKYFT